ncbi:MAG TPA: DUF58 domain-containing protein [Candidatus Anammoximicrobium sp.]|nr:DUF58 domain-containing protein [Candidatus Anammoximicrobium sp.]
MPTRHRTSLCREGWYLLLLLAVVLTWALLRENNLLLLVAGLMAAMLLINWRLSVAALRRLEVRRCAVSNAHAGSWLTIELEVANTRRRLGSWALSVEDSVKRQDDQRDMQPVRPSVMFPYLPAGQSMRQSYRVCLPQRGRYALGPLRVSTRFPFGLVQRALWHPGDDQLLVLPRLGRLRPAWLQHYQPAPHGTRGARRPGYVPGDFFAVREWQAGDSVRWVHWRSTARHRELVVRQFEQPGERELGVLLDLWEPDEPQPDQRQRVELAVSFAATLVVEFCCSNRGQLLLATASARPVCLEKPASVAMSREALEALALAQASSIAPLSALRNAAFSRARPQFDMVLISTRERAGAELEDLLAAAGSAAPGARRRLVHLAASDSTLADYFEDDRRLAEAPP